MANEAGRTLRFKARLLRANTNMHFVKVLAIEANTMANIAVF
jgi:hypothetical protein